MPSYKGVLKAGWNSRYVAYAEAHQVTPDEMLTFDAERWPGGQLAGFICWIDAQWARFRAVVRACSHNQRPRYGADDHDAFDAWLANRPWSRAHSD